MKKRKPKPKLGGVWYYIYLNSEIEIRLGQWICSLEGNENYKNNNCFRTRKEASQVASKIRQILKMSK